MPVAPWLSLGGTARRYQNSLTGETISREKYERLYGSLARRGATSFKQAAKRTPPEVRALRPSKAPTYARKPAQGAAKFSGLEPLVGRQTRAVEIPFHAFWDGDVSSFLDDAKPYKRFYDDAIKRIQNNSKINRVQVYYNFQNLLTMQHGIRPVDESLDKFSADTFNEVCMKIVENLQSRTNIEVIALELRVGFYLRYVKKATAKRGLRLRPKRKAR